MDILIKDGVKYIQTDFHGREDEFEKIVFSQYKHLFGDYAILFPKQKIKTATNIGTIPDAFIVDFKQEKWFIIEVEISNHDVYNHIAPQLLKFKSALDNSQTRRQLIDFFDKEIQRDPFKGALFASSGKLEMFKTVTQIVESKPELIIIIEQEHEELTSVFKSLPFKTSINVFKTYFRNGLEFGETIFQIEPITISSFQQIVVPATVKSLQPQDNNIQRLKEVNPSGNFNASNGKATGAGDSDVLVEQIIPVIKLVIENGRGYYTRACKEIAATIINKKSGKAIDKSSVMSVCTRGLGFHGTGSKDLFLDHIEKGTIKNVLLKKYSYRADIIENSL